MAQCRVTLVGLLPPFPWVQEKSFSPPPHTAMNHPSLTPIHSSPFS